MNLANRNILEIAHRLRAKLRRVGTEHIGPCPRCGGRDRFSVSTLRGLFNCRGCAVGGDAIELVRHIRGCDFREALEFIGADTSLRAIPLRQERTNPTPPAPDEDNRSKALVLWRRRRTVDGSPVEVYLRRARGYAGPIPATLGYLPPSGDYPAAMVAAYALASEPNPGDLSVEDANVRAIHLTRLTPDGDKIDKITLGRGAAGFPIVIAAPNDLLGLAVTEGIEDALSVHLATGLGAWAAGSAGFLPKLADSVPAYVEHVLIVADADPAGQRGAHELADRLDARRIAAAVKTLAARHEGA